MVNSKKKGYKDNSKTPLEFFFLTSDKETATTACTHRSSFPDEDIPHTANFELQVKAGIQSKPHTGRDAVCGCLGRLSGLSNTTG